MLKKPYETKQIFCVRCSACDGGHLGLDYVSIMDHIKSRHGLTKPTYVKQYGNLEYAIITHV